MRSFLRPARSIRGLSLIEVMVALAIGSFLLIGVLQIFSSSSAAFRVNEASSRIQEAGRFALDFVRRDARMVGHMGCVNDRTHFAPGVAPTFQSTFIDAGAGQTLDAAPFALRFDLSLQAFEANDTEPGEAWPLEAAPVIGGAADWTPSLPPELEGVTGGILAGSDVLVVRYFSAEAIRSYGPAGLTFTSPDSVTGEIALSTSFSPFPLEAGGFYGAADCMRARVFQLSVGAAALPATVRVIPGAGRNAAGFESMESLDGFREIFVAESVAYYVGVGTGGEPALFRARLTDAGGWRGEELVEGVENMQLLFGYDPLLRDMTGDYVTAEAVDALPGTEAANWLSIVSMRAGFVIRNTDLINVPRQTVDPSILGVTLTLPDAADEPVARLRRTYETTVSLRNRLRTI